MAHPRGSGGLVTERFYFSGGMIHSGKDNPKLVIRKGLIRYPPLPGVCNISQAD